MSGRELVLSRTPPPGRACPGAPGALEREHEELLRQLLSHTTATYGRDAPSNSGSRTEGVSLESVGMQQTLLVLEHYYFRTGCDGARLCAFVDRLARAHLLDVARLGREVPHIQQLRARFLSALLPLAGTSGTTPRGLLALAPVLLRAGTTTSSSFSSSSITSSRATNSNNSTSTTTSEPNPNETALTRTRTPSVLGAGWGTSAADSLLQHGLVEVAALGRGAFGAVVEARSVVDGMRYAVKKIPFRVPLALAASARVERVLREVCALAQLDHPNVLRYYSCWLDVREPAPASRPSSVTVEDEGTWTSSDEDGGDDDEDDEDDESDTPLPEALQDSLEGDLEGRIVFGSRSSNGKCEDEEDEDEDDEGTATIEDESTHATSFLDSTCGVESCSGLGDSTREFDEEDEDEDDDENHYHHNHKSNHEGAMVPAGAMQRRGTEWVHLVLYLQTQYCAGGSLRDWLDSGARTAVDGAAAFAIFRGTLEGVAHIHSRGIVHRDLKPANIFFDVDAAGRRTVKIGDFGLAKILTRRTHDAGRANNAFGRDGADGATGCVDDDGDGSDLELDAVTDAETEPEPYAVVSRDIETDVEPNTRGVGTVPYASPEQLRATDYTAKADIYSLGIILLELYSVFGTASERARVIGDLRALGRVPAATAARFPEAMRLVRAMTAPCPAHRPSAADILRHPDYRRLERTSAQLSRPQLEQEIAELRQLLRLREEQLARLPG